MMANGICRVTVSDIMKSILCFLNHERKSAVSGDIAISVGTDGIYSNKALTPILKWNEFCEHTVLQNMDVLQYVYNLPYTLLIGNSQYFYELLNDEDVIIQHNKEDLDRSVRYLDFTYKGAEYKTCIRCYISRPDVVCINKPQIPIVKSLMATDIKSARININSGTLTVSKQSVGTGMTVIYKTDSVQDKLFNPVNVGALLGLGKHQSPMLGTELPYPMELHNSDNAGDDGYVYIRNILRNKGTVNDRYNRLVRALECVSEDMPGTINIILKSLEEEFK